MTRILLTAIGALALIVATSYANAADTYAKQTSVKDTYQAGTAVAVETSANWSGVWIAALAGYSMSNSAITTHSYDNIDGGLKDSPGAWWNDTYDATGKLDGFGGEGFDLTAQLGGDIQIGRIVVGGWGEYSFGGVESSASVAGLGRLDVEQNDSYGAFARAGLVSGDTLFYGAVGYVWTEADAKLRVGDDTYRETFDFSGPAVEGGIEHRFSPGIRGKLSARYTWMDEETLVSEYNTTTGDGFDLRAEPGVWSVKAGLVISTEAMFSRGLGIFTAD